MTSSLIKSLKDTSSLENSNSLLSSTKLVVSSIIENQSKTTMNGNGDGANKSTLNRLSRASQNEVITLPPIVEAQVSSTGNGFNNFHKKSRSNTNRIDSGIANTDSEILPTNAWTLSQNGSDNDESNSKFNGKLYIIFGNFLFN